MAFFPMKEYDDILAHARKPLPRRRIRTVDAGKFSG
jgi:hypothetical protein